MISNIQQIWNCCWKCTFIAVAGFQGFMLFLLFPCRSKHAREVWKKWFYYATCRPHTYKENLRVLKTHSKGKYVKKSSSTPADENLTQSCFLQPENKLILLPTVLVPFLRVLAAISDSLKTVEELSEGDPDGIDESVIDSETYTVSSFKPTLESSTQEKVGTSTPDKFIPMGSPLYSSGSSHSPDSEACVVANYHAHDNEN